MSRPCARIQQYRRIMRRQSLPETCLAPHAVVSLREGENYAAARSPTCASPPSTSIRSLSMRPSSPLINAKSMSIRSSRRFALIFGDPYQIQELQALDLHVRGQNDTRSFQPPSLVGVLPPEMCFCTSLPSSG
jgi:hypothetical protein